jgi:hypothetical protein
LPRSAVVGLSPWCPDRVAEGGETTAISAAAETLLSGE